METIKIAIDGPAGAGKTTIAKAMAKKFGYLYVDTGALYRAVALKTIRTGVDLQSPEDIEAMMKETTVLLEYNEFGEQRVILDGQDVTDELRTPQIAMYASDISAIPSVRHGLVQLQRDLAYLHNVIMDGRDIASVVLPHANLKLFLTATLEERAIRRFNEQKINQIDLSFDEVKKEMKQRDKNDSSRESAPLMLVADAIVVDTSDNTLEQTIEIVENIIKEKLMLEE